MMVSELLEPEWLRKAVGYEIYIRSFADGDGDGTGDLDGLHDRLDHLAWLGVDIVWITPFFPSPGADQGYDVANYVDIDPLFGDFDAFDRVVARAHELGLRLVIDIVPNHSSNQHPWFTQAIADPDGPYRDYYLWRDPAPDGGPPNNWISHFGGPAWTLDEASNQYYCNLFLPEQPDLNWRNPAVRAEFMRILEFWFERGVDGIRIDVAHALIKDADFRDNPTSASLIDPSDPRGVFRSFDHIYDLTQPESLEVYREWRELADCYGTVLIGETYVLTAEDLGRLVPGDGLHVAFWFALMRMSWDPHQIRSLLRAPIEPTGGRVGWVQSSHDESRPVARFGGGDLGRRRSLGLSVMLLGLPGLPFLYQGEELGLDDGCFPAELRVDPIATRNEGAIGRDVCRTPMPWEPGHNLGFSTADRTWLPIGHDDRDTVAVQRDDLDSPLHRMRSLLAFRRTLPELPTTTDWPSTPPDIVAFRRQDHLFVLNTGDDRIEWSPGGSWSVVFRTLGPLDDSTHSRFALGGAEAIVAVAV